VSAGTVAQALLDARRAGVDALDAQCLLADLLDRPRTWLLAHDDAVLDAAQLAAFAARLQRRGAGEPLAYLVGKREFFGLSLTVGPEVLVPRPETELLVDWAIELLRAWRSPAAPRVADLGTGSGAIALAIKAAVPQARVWASDVSPAALGVAQGNAHRLGLEVEFACGSWWQPARGLRFDLVVSNPPYIDAADPHLRALAHEPLGALTPGDDGASALREICAGARDHLEPGAWLLLEHGFAQGAVVRGFFAAAGLAGAATRRDLAGQERCTGAAA
jgi:release factor glutamine methyltransferase